MINITKIISGLAPEEDINSGTFETVTDNALRFKVTDVCSWGCSFCHKEGGWDKMQVAGWKEEDQRTFEKFKVHGYNEVHLTGGEPTLNPNAPRIIKGLSDMGYAVKATSILGGKPDVLRQCADAGLTGVNVSIHADFGDVEPETGFVPEEIVQAIAGLQIGKTSTQARKQILALTRGINVLKNTNVKIKANTVISSEADLKKATSVYKYAKKLGLGLRLLPDLSPSMRKRSTAAIREFLQSIGAKFVRAKTTKGSSDATAFFVDSEGYELGVKLIDDVFLETMCTGCETKEQGKCTEKYYGIRLEKLSGSNDPYHVRLCLHEKLSSVIMPVDKFLDSPQFQEILKSR